MTPHPLAQQLRFARAEFARALAGITDDEARQVFPPLNCLSWGIGHLAWQEQRHWFLGGPGFLLARSHSLQGEPGGLGAYADRIERFVADAGAAPDHGDRHIPFAELFAIIHRARRDARAILARLLHPSPAAPTTSRIVARTGFAPAEARRHLAVLEAEAEAGRIAGTPQRRHRRGDGTSRAAVA